MNLPMWVLLQVYCTHTEPNFSLPWQKQRQYSSTGRHLLIRFCSFSSRPGSSHAWCNCPPNHQLGTNTACPLCVQWLYDSWAKTAHQCALCGAPHSGMNMVFDCKAFEPSEEVQGKVLSRFWDSVTYEMMAPPCLHCC